ncbi:MAG: LysR family transcriptional regulator [Planctomycetes bacterium]|nr:LysR family transcriptional regulator [Planctomycetota bacterium]
MILLHRLEGFYWVARTGGYHAAARAFPYPITQPAVHQQVSKLQDELGFKLLERVAKDRMQLTPAGRKLFEFCAPFFEELPTLVRALQAGEYGGVLRIYAAPLVLRQLMPGWLKRLHKAHPEMQIELRELVEPDFKVLRDGAADLLVDYLPELPNDMASMQVGSLRAFLVLPAGHALADKKRASLATLKDETFISYNPGMVPFDLQMQAFQQHGLTPKRTLSAGSAETILGFVEAGMGFSLVPSLDPDGPKGKGIVAIPLASPKVEYPVVAAWRKDTPENALLDAVLEAAPR